jgi:hypothetical protein
MSWLRTVMLLCLIVWIGGLIFFAFVLAPTVFTVLPTREMAGNVVNPSLSKLHWMGLVSGILFLSCSLVYNQLRHAQLRSFSMTHGLLALMLALTLYSQFSITPRMRVLRTEMGVIDSVPHSDPRRVEFNRLHERSTRAEGGVFVMALIVVLLTARRFGN